MGFLDEAGLRRLWDRVKGLVGIPIKRALTQAEYEALSEEEKAADVVYIITDDNGGVVENFNGRAGAVSPQEGDYSADMISGLSEALAAKQDKLTGAAGQVVGFDESGKAVAQKAPSGGMTQAEADARYIQPGGSYPGASYTQLGSFAFGDDGVISLSGRQFNSDLYFESVKTKTKIGNLAAPSIPDDAATKEYVDRRTAGATIKVEKVLIPKNTEAGTVIKSSVLYRTNSGDNIEPVVAIPQAGQEDWFEDGKITWKVIVQYSFVDDSYSYVVEVTVNTPPAYDAQLPWQYFLHIFRLFIAIFALFHLLSDTLHKQGFRIFHVCLWLIMWSETLAALGVPVLKQYCPRPRKWSNLNQAVLNRLSTLGRYQAMNCTSVYNEK